jgi:hypothetical protein
VSRIVLLGAPITASEGHPARVASATAAPCNRAVSVALASISPRSMAASTTPKRSAISRPALSRCDGDRPARLPASSVRNWSRSVSARASVGSGDVTSVWNVRVLARRVDDAVALRDLTLRAAT